MNYLKSLTFEQLFELKQEVDYQFEIAKRNDLCSIIEEFSKLSRSELISIIKKYKIQIDNVRNNHEYEELEKRIKIAGGILNVA
jgi:hypothetical protein